MAWRRAVSSKEVSAAAHTPPPASQNRAKTQYLGLSVSVTSSPEVISISSKRASGCAVSFGFHLCEWCEPSQYGLFFEAPQRHSEVGSFSVEKCLPSSNVQLSPNSLGTMCCVANGGCPYTKYGPLLLTTILYSGAAGVLPLSIFCFTIVISDVDFRFFIGQ